MLSLCAMYPEVTAKDEQTSDNRSEVPVNYGVCNAFAPFDAMVTHSITARRTCRACKRQARAPKGSPEFCRTFGVLQEGSAECSA